LALLCLGQRLEQSLEEFARLNVAAKEDVPTLGKSQPHLEEMGTVLWLLGRRKEAMNTFRSGIQGIRDGSIIYGDLAGGASHGLLLWYAGVTAKDSEVRKFAEDYLAWLARDEEYGKYGRFFWPEPLPLFIIWHLNADQVLMEVVQTTDADEAIRRAVERSTEDKGICHSLVEALFYLAVMRRAQGHEADCRSGMARCAGMENPITSVEWFLARAEAGYVPGTKDWPWRPVAKPKSRTGRK